MTNLLLPEADGAVLLFTLSVIVDVTINCILIRTLSDVLNFQDSAFRDFHAVSVSPFISPPQTFSYCGLLVATPPLISVLIVSCICYNQGRLSLSSDHNHFDHLVHSDHNHFPRREVELTCTTGVLPAPSCGGTLPSGDTFEF